MRPHVENAFAAAWRGEAEVDGFNELVLRAGLTWRQVVVLRAYAKYLRQTGTVFSQDYMESTLRRLPGDRRACWCALFEARFSPRLELADEERARRSARSWSTRSAGSSTTSTASTRTGSCAST